MLEDTGIAALTLLARIHGIACDAQQLRHEAALDGKLFQVNDLLLIGKRLGLKCKSIMIDPKRLHTTPLPAIGIGKTAEGQDRFFLIASVNHTEQNPEYKDNPMVLVQCPIEGKPQRMRLSELQAQWHWQGDVILVASRAQITGRLSKFDFTWFIPAVVKYRKLLLEVLAVSFVLQLFALITPLFFQVVMDKVLVHRGLTTLDVLALGLGVVVVFEVILGTLRSYVFSHTTSRIDVELGAKLFRHLLALPLPYFQARRVGDSVARVRELENIRNFLTGNALTLVLDVVFGVVFIAVMLHYSVWLSLIVIASLPIYAIISFISTPILRERLAEKFSRGAENQSFLVETLSGMDTVKSMAVEPLWTRNWDKQLAAYVQSGFRTQVVATLAHNGVNLVSKLVSVLLLYFGARLVIENQITVGQLIAFNMLAGQVAQPIMRLAHLWTDFQQTAISVERLGDILNTQTEWTESKTPMPAIKGEIQLEQISFRYRLDAPPVLKNINLNVSAGEFIGIVGKSGSGKSTLSKLLQRLYVPEQGRIYVDGMDLNLADQRSLRRQVGVVLQDNMLFARSVRDNIALAEPGTPLDKIMMAAQLAGAHEFITQLPEGYDTLVGEHGATLSGGQRQRIAIARALLHNPRILIFDEATSALDYESESIIQQNMRKIAQGRTVIVIAHRLSAVRDAKRIVVLDKGEIVEIGTPEALLQPKPDGSLGHFAHLWALQHGPRSVRSA